MGDWAIWGFLLAGIDLTLALGVTIHAVLWKRDSRSIIAWVGLAWLAPILGGLAYLILGINRLHRKAGALCVRDAWRAAQADSDVPGIAGEERGPREDLPSMRGLVSAVERLTGEPLLFGNQVEPLIDGDQAYPAMIRAIEGARGSVALSSYIFDDDDAGEAFRQALLRSARRGVEVRVLVDDIGARYSRPTMVRRLARDGLKVATFLPTRLAFARSTANLRNHRKILVVDGELGFTGGTNIREEHWLERRPRHPVQCLHFAIRGPVVRTLQKVFASDWAFTTGELLSGPLWFPELEEVGPVWARGIEHGPDENFEKLVDVIGSALACAQQRVTILTPYFLPQATLISALNIAALRGVDVRIYVPAANNVALVHWASTAQLWQILEKGCRVFQTPPPFDHTKLMIVDDRWTLLGSTNWDPRSLRLNFEFNVECHDTALAARLRAIVEDKAAKAEEVTLEEVDARRFPIRLRDGLARLLTPYL